MTEQVLFLEHLPARGIFDGELVALDEDGKPDFPLICECVLQRQNHVALTLMIFDVLSIDGDDCTRLPYSKRRTILEALNLNGERWRTPQVFDDGAALWHAVCEHELEGVVAKKRTSRYASAERGWLKVKNRNYWRWELEREGALKARLRPSSRRPAEVQPANGK